MSKEQIHKNGRPSKTGQLHIQQELRPYFEQGVSAHTAAQKTGINVKTVCKYFDVWIQEIIELEDSDFLERQKKQRAQIIISYDNQILDANKHLDDINEQINQLKKEKKQIPLHLFSLRLDALKYRTFVVDKRNVFLNQPTMDEALEKKFAKDMQKHGNLRTDN